MTHLYIKIGLLSALALTLPVSTFASGQYSIKYRLPNPSEWIGNRIPTRAIQQGKGTGTTRKEPPVRTEKQPTESKGVRFADIAFRK